MNRPSHQPTETQPLSLPPPSVKHAESSDEGENTILTNVSINTVNDVLPTSINHLRRRVKYQIPPSKIERPPIGHPVINVTNKEVVAKILQKERIEKALSMRKQTDGPKMKRIVFNGTFPIDDPYSSRFDTYVDEEGGIYDDEYDYEYDDDDFDGDDQDAEDPSDYDQEEDDEY